MRRSIERKYMTLGVFWFLDCLAFWESTSSSSLLGGELFAPFWIHDCTCERVF
jgi:hypothetical protein